MWLPFNSRDFARLCQRLKVPQIFNHRLLGISSDNRFPHGGQLPHPKFLKHRDHRAPATRRFIKNNFPRVMGVASDRFPRDSLPRLILQYFRVPFDRLVPRSHRQMRSGLASPRDADNLLLPRRRVLHVMPHSIKRFRVGLPPPRFRVFICWTTYFASCTVPLQFKFTIFSSASSSVSVNRPPPPTPALMQAISISRPSETAASQNCFTPSRVARSACTA